jgi:hypothetical protein
LGTDRECIVFDVSPGLSDSVDPDLRDGWLCFESAGERRQLGPIPPDWQNLPELELALLWERAKRVARITPELLSFLDTVLPETDGL